MTDSNIGFKISALGGIVLQMIPLQFGEIGAGTTVAGRFTNRIYARNWATCLQFLFQRLNLPLLLGFVLILSRLRSVSNVSASLRRRRQT